MNIRFGRRSHCYTSWCFKMAKKMLWSHFIVSAEPLKREQRITVYILGSLRQPTPSVSTLGILSVTFDSALEVVFIKHWNVSILPLHVAADFPGTRLWSGQIVNTVFPHCIQRSSFHCSRDTFFHFSPSPAFRHELVFWLMLNTCCK